MGIEHWPTGENDLVPGPAYDRMRKDRDEWRRISAEQQADYGQLQQRLRGAVAAERARFHEYVREYGRLGYDAAHLDHFLNHPGGQ